MKKHVTPFFIQTLWVFVALSFLQVIFYVMGSGGTLPGGGYGEFFLRKLIAIALLALLVSYAAKWCRNIEAWWRSNPVIRQLFQSHGFSAERKPDKD